MPGSLIYWYRRFGGTCCLHLQVSLSRFQPLFTEMLVPAYLTRQSYPRSQECLSFAAMWVLCSNHTKSEDSGLLRCDNVLMCEKVQALCTVIVPSSSESNSPRSSFGLFDPVDEGSVTLQNAWNFSPTYVLSCLEDLNRQQQCCRAWYKTMHKVLSVTGQIFWLF